MPRRLSAGLPAFGGRDREPVEQVATHRGFGGQRPVAPLAANDRPQREEDDHGAHALLLMSDWLTALHDLVIENAGFQEGSELSPAQARTLAAIVAAVDVQARALVQ